MMKCPYVKACKKRALSPMYLTLTPEVICDNWDGISDVHICREFLRRKLKGRIKHYKNDSSNKYHWMCVTGAVKACKEILSLLESDHD